MSADLYSWDAPAEPPKVSFAPKMPAGRHKVRIAAIKHTNKDGSEYQTSDGEPQCIFIFANAKGEEASQWATLTMDPEKSWAIRAILRSITPAMNFAKMKEHGVTPVSFADAAFAQKQLIGTSPRELAIEVSYSPRKGVDKQGKPFEPWCNITYLASGTVVEPAPAAAEVPDEEIPF